MVDRRLVINFDWILLVLLIILAFCGAGNLYSAASKIEIIGTPIYLKQFYWFCLGLVVMLAIAVIGYQQLSIMAYPFYLFVIMLLLAVLLFGRVVSGAQRWLTCGPLVIQPSELAKLSVLLILARYFYRRDQVEPYKLRQLILPLTFTVIPAILVLKEPDLGSALIILVVGSSVILVNRLKQTSLILAIASLLGIMPISWHFLKNYQKKRIISFLNPENDPLGSAYHLIQSKIAVGSGKFYGKGFMAGTQSQLNFLPEQHTDFALSVLAEEWGFIGSTLIIILLAAVVFRSLMHAIRAKDRMGMLIVIGGTACVFWPAVINIGMVVGLFPVVGIPLPFISYGGSSMISTMAALGLIQSVSINRFIFYRN